MTLRNDDTAFLTGKWSRLAVTMALVWTTAVYPVFAQTSSGDTAQPKPPETVNSKPAQAGADPTADLYSLTELEYLLGPIALYPDPLLALILPASAFDDQIVEAQNLDRQQPASCSARRLCGSGCQAVGFIGPGADALSGRDQNAFGTSGLD